MNSWFDAFMEWSFKLVMMPTMVVCVIALGVGLVALPFIIYGMATSPPPTYIQLPVNTWACTKYETHTYTQMILVGKVMVPQMRTDSVCVEYGMKHG